MYYDYTKYNSPFINLQKYKKNNESIDIIYIYLFIIILIISVVLSLWIVKLTWNNSVSRIFNLPEISLKKNSIEYKKHKKYGLKYYG